MIFSRIVQIVAIVILESVSRNQLFPNSSFYSYSGPISGYTDVDLTPGGLGIGGFVANFGTINETLYYNPTAETLREVGSVTVNPANGSFNINGSFFEPGSGSANLTVGNNGGFSFDDTCNFMLPGLFDSTLLVPVSGSGTYDGQAWAGSWNLDLQLAEQILAKLPQHRSPLANRVSGLFLLNNRSMWCQAQTLRTAPVMAHTTIHGIRIPLRQRLQLRMHPTHLNYLPGP